MATKVEGDLESLSDRSHCLPLEVGLDLGSREHVPTMTVQGRDVSVRRG